MGASALRRTTELQHGRALLTNDYGDYAILQPGEQSALNAGVLPLARQQDLEARGLLTERAEHDLERAVLRTRKSFLLEGPSLHIFVVTLRCDHSCQYCQVSRASLDARGYDMSPGDAEAALDRVFESPSRNITIEFQGGEPALRFDLVRQIVESARLRNQKAGKALRFTMTSTLHHLDASALAFCAAHEIHLSTSIDGPAQVHDAQRPNPTRDAWSRTIEGLARARAALGDDGVVALPTITRRTLADPIGLIDHYRALGFRSIFLRPLSPYGFARKTAKVLGYNIADYVAFYEAALDYILELNAAGQAFEEAYSAILLRHIWTPFHSGYVDLRSPSGAGLGVLVYNYDGQVYPSDEARMAAETGDRRFALGHVTDSLDNLMASPAMQWLRTGAVAEDLADCNTCAFVPYCGADPVHHAVVQGDPAASRIESDFCRRHLGLFRLLFAHIEAADPETLRTFTAWAFQRPRREIVVAGHVVQ